ncbi:MAG: redoxin family protein [Rickettsiales bacterium]|nr:redoxin family protein [Rickettsiales bacterium]
MWKWFRLISLLIVIPAAIFLVISADEPLDIYQKRPMPPLELNGLNGGTVSTAKWALETDGPKVINLFASWCSPCIKEIPALQSLRRHLPVYGIAFRDKPKDLKKWLAKHGNPYTEIGIDKGLTFIWDLGITGVPTTLLLDATQKIVYIHQGLLTESDIQNEILPRLEKLEND